VFGEIVDFSTNLLFAAGFSEISWISCQRFGLLSRETYIGRHRTQLLQPLRSYCAHAGAAPFLCPETLSLLHLSDRDSHRRSRNCGRTTS